MDLVTHQITRGRWKDVGTVKKGFKKKKSDFSSFGQFLGSGFCREQQLRINEVTI